MKVTIEMHEVVGGPVLKTTTIEFIGEHAQWHALDYLLGQSSPEELLTHADEIKRFAEGRLAEVQ